MAEQGFADQGVTRIDDHGDGTYVPLTKFEDRFRDVLGRLKVTSQQNIFDADFEYSTQPLRWENYTAGSGTIAAAPILGGVKMNITGSSGDLTIRQSRPYHRYQPGKTMAMNTAINFGGPNANQYQRVGFFDDSNGVFFEQGPPTAQNPYGMAVVWRTSTSGLPVDTKFYQTNSSGYSDWNGDATVRNLLNWNNIQMLFIEYAWYGAGLVRWGVMINGEPIILHQIGFGNYANQQIAWSKTGNLPVRYEQRNAGASSAAQLVHFGVSVTAEGRIDDQRGFTYSYGNPQSAPLRTVAGNASRFPLISLQGRLMGVTAKLNDGTTNATSAAQACTAGTTTSMTVNTGSGTNAWTANQWVGYYVGYYVSGTAYTARITANTATSGGSATLTLADIVTGGALGVAPVSSGTYSIGILNRGQILPRRLQLTSTQPVYVELFSSTTASPITLTGASFAANAAATNSFATIDSSATAFTVSGENVYSVFVPANNPVDEQIDQLFPLYNNVQGNRPDILTVCVTNTSASSAQVSAQIIGQEAMS